MIGFNLEVKIAQNSIPFGNLIAIIAHSLRTYLWFYALRPLA